MLEGAPVLVVYNGNPDVLTSAVSMCILAYGEPRPSQVVGHGFRLGTTGTLGELERHFGLDPKGIAHVIAKAGVDVSALVECTPEYFR
jgi:hypothetical protein